MLQGAFNTTVRVPINIYTTSNQWNLSFQSPIPTRKYFHPTFLVQTPAYHIRSNQPWAGKARTQNIGVLCHSLIIISAIIKYKTVYLHLPSTIPSISYGKL